MAEFAGGRLFLLGSSLIAIGTAGFYYLPGMIEADAAGSRLINSIYVSDIAISRTCICITLEHGLGTFQPVIFLTSVFHMHYACIVVLDDDIDNVSPILQSAST
jgi:hypothetical protein